jgi:hypothetical protein
MEALFPWLVLFSVGLSLAVYLWLRGQLGV